MQLYKNSPFYLFQQFFPSHDWLPWKFQEIPLPTGFWQSPENVNEYLGWLSKQLHIKTSKDWNRVSVADLRRLGGAGLLNCYGSFAEVLQKYKPSEYKVVTSERVCQFKNQKLIFSLTTNLLEDSLPSSKETKSEDTVK